MVHVGVAVFVSATVHMTRTHLVLAELSKSTGLAATDRRIIDDLPIRVVYAVLAVRLSWPSTTYTLTITFPLPELALWTGPPRNASTPAFRVLRGIFDTEIALPCRGPEAA
jgi:hypothetical protein